MICTQNIMWAYTAFSSLVSSFHKYIIRSIVVQPVPTYTFVDIDVSSSIPESIKVKDWDVGLINHEVTSY